MVRARNGNRAEEFIAHPKRAVWTIAFPMMTGFMAYALYMVGDMAFIGQLGPSALAGAQFVGSLFFGVVALNIGFTTGVTAVIARAVGAGDKQAAERIAANAMGLGFLIGIVLAGLGWLTGSTLIPILGAEGETAELAWQYFQVICFGMIVMFVSGAVRAVLTGEGDARTPMTVTIISTLLNLTLDPIFMFVLDLGIRGAALATVCSQLFTITAFSYVAFIKRRSYVAFRWQASFLRPRWHLLAPVLKIGLPAALGQLVTSFGAMLYNRIISDFGQTAVAGYGAGSKMDLIVGLPIIALSNAVLSVVGIFSGAGRADLVRSTVLYAYRSVLLITVVLSTMAFVLSNHIIDIFTDDPHALQVGHLYLRYVVFAYPLMAFGITSGRILQGLGFGMQPLFITLARVLIVGVPVAYLGAMYFNAIEAVWVGMIGGALVANLLSLYWIHRHVWKKGIAVPKDSLPPEMP